MDIKVLDDVPADGAEGELEAEAKEGPDEPPSPRRPRIRLASRRTRSAST